VDFPHLWSLHGRGVHWVTRCLERFRHKVLQARPAAKNPRIKRDVLVAPLTWHSRRNHPGPLRLVEAEVEVDGRPQTMTFLTNNLARAASSVAELYRCRWQIEVFFKQLKQTVQLADFLGHSANAVKWQVWTALLVNLLMRFLAWRSGWAHSFNRLFTFVRAALWRKLGVDELLRRHGTADGDIRCIGQPSQAWLPGWAP
jgi:IS4 transposase